MYGNPNFIYCSAQSDKKKCVILGPAIDGRDLASRVGAESERFDLLSTLFDATSPEIQDILTTTR